MVKKGHKYVTLLQINVPKVMILSKKLVKNILRRGHLFEMEGHLFDKEGHLFDGKGHLFWEASQFCYKLLGGRNFDHVYEPLLLPICHFILDHTTNYPFARRHQDSKRRSYYFSLSTPR